jgi:pimeloyl-ACP methyl ester carboxylesterase
MATIERSVKCLGPHGFHEMAYAEWPGPEGAPTLLCVHGLTRNGHDFDTMAEALSAHYRVICPDMPGRGRSEWLTVPADYGYPLYIADCVTLIARLDVGEVDWVGTSMGGLIGMLIAAQPGNPIRKLVINDVGPLVAKEGLERIAAYVGADPSFPSLAALEAAMRKIAVSFGPLTDEQFRLMALHMSRKRPDGSFGFAYDPGIAEAFKVAPPADIDLWPVWDAIKAPSLLLRGAVSDLLRRDDAIAMTQRGPRAKLVEFAGVGHAPALLSEDQIGAVRDFLLG